MKKLLAFVLAGLCFAGVYAASKNSNVIENADGTVSIINIDYDGAVKYGQKYEGFKNVTIVDGSKVTKRNPISVDLGDFADREIVVSFSVDMKLVDAVPDRINEIIWTINDFDAGMPVLCKKKVNSGEWVNYSGSIMLTIGKKKSFYISGAGLNMADLKFYLKNIEITIEGDGIGTASTTAMDWMVAPSIKTACRSEFDYFGLAVTWNNCFVLPEVQAGVKRHADTITMGNEMKPDFVFGFRHPARTEDFVASDGKTYQVPRGIPVFKTVDSILAAAKENGLKIRGHVLVWHSQTPHWFFVKDYSMASMASFVDPATMTARQEWYIKTLIEHVTQWEKENNGGQRIVFAWDVVNEAVSDGANSQKWLREESDWFRVYGNEEFILNAFKFANKYAPADVELVYNDYNCYMPGKRNAICNLIDKIKAYPGARIDAVGMQSHVKISYPEVTGRNSFEEAVKAFVAHGVNVQVTELDIANGSSKYSPTLLKSAYKNYFTMFMNNRKTNNRKGIEGVTIWGLTDDTTWLNNLKEYSGNTQYPLLLNSDYTIKPAFNGVIEALESVN